MSLTSSKSLPALKELDRTGEEYGYASMLCIELLKEKQTVIIHLLADYLNLVGQHMNWV